MNAYAKMGVWRAREKEQSSENGPLDARDHRLSVSSSLTVSAGSAGVYGQDYIGSARPVLENEAVCAFFRGLLNREIALWYQIVITVTIPYHKCL